MQIGNNFVCCKAKIGIMHYFGNNKKDMQMHTQLMVTGR